MDIVSFARSKRYTDDALKPFSKAKADAVLQGYVLDDMRDASLWTASGSGAVEAYNDDPEYPLALKITAPQGSYTNVSRPLSFNAHRRFLSFKVKRLDQNFSRISLGLSVGGYGFTQRFENTVITRGAIIKDKWHTVTVPMSGLIANGSPTPSSDLLENVFQVNFETHAESEGNAEILVADLKVHDDPISPAIIWHFDDGRADTYTRAFPVLSAAGFVGQVAVETGNVGNPNRCSLEQLQEMHAAGWAMLNHTTDGQQLNSNNLTEMRSKITTAYTYLLRNGLTRGAEHFVYPGGHWNSIIYTEVLKYCHTARVAGQQTYETPYLSDYGRLRPCYFTTSITLSGAKAAVNRMIERGGILYFTFHSLVDSLSQTEDWLYSDFQELVAYVKELGIPSVTVEDVWKPKG